MLFSIRANDSFYLPQYGFILALFGNPFDEIHKTFNRFSLVNVRKLWYAKRSDVKGHKIIGAFKKK